MNQVFLVSIFPNGPFVEKFKEVFKHHTEPTPIDPRWFLTHFPQVEDPVYFYDLVGLAKYLKERNVDSMVGLCLDVVDLDDEVEQA